MTDIIDLHIERIRRDPETLRLKMFSDNIDVMVTELSQNGSDPIAIAAILLNRFKAAADAANASKGFNVKEILVKTYL